MEGAAGFGTLSQLLSVGHELDLAVAAVADTKSLQQAQKWLDIYDEHRPFYERVQADMEMPSDKKIDAFSQGIEILLFYARQGGLSGEKESELRFAFEREPEEDKPPSQYIDVYRRIETFSLCNNHDPEHERAIMEQRAGIVKQLSVYNKDFASKTRKFGYGPSEMAPGVQKRGRTRKPGNGPGEMATGAQKRDYGLQGGASRKGSADLSM